MTAQHRVFGRAQQAHNTAQRMTYQPRILAGAVHFSACKIVQLLDQVWPVAGDLVVRFMAKSVYGLNGVVGGGDY